MMQTITFRTLVTAMSVALLAAGCAGRRPVEVAPHPAPVVDASPTPAVGGGRPAPVTGWPAEYDAHVEAEVAKTPALLALPVARMSAFCPGWGGMNEAARKRFFADLLYAIAGPESAWDRRAMYNETGIIDRQTGAQAIDGVTGRPIISEGLLQLSYADMQSYPPKGGLACAFDWTRDRAAFEADLTANAGRKSFKSAHPERSILDPYVQLSCGVHILDRLFAGDTSHPFASTAGKYWSTMRPAATSQRDVVANLRARKSACFESS